MLQLPLELGRGGRGPLYRRLYEALARQIRAGAIPAGARLPGKRTLAAELSVSVNTVDTAYQMLAAEGYIESRPRSGFVVLPVVDLLPATVRQAAARLAAAEGADFAAGGAPDGPDAAEGRAGAIGVMSGPDGPGAAGYAGAGAGYGAAGSMAGAADATAGADEAARGGKAAGPGAPAGDGASRGSAAGTAAGFAAAGYVGTAAGGGAAAGADEAEMAGAPAANIASAGFGASAADGKNAGSSAAGAAESSAADAAAGADRAAADAAGTAAGISAGTARGGEAAGSAAGTDADGPGAAAAGDAPVRFDLRTAGVDTTLFPFRTWGRIQKELLYASPELLAHGAAQGDENLRTALAGYLAAYRGVQCTPDQIVVGAGLEYLLGLVAPLLAGRLCGVEDPGYSSTRTILQNSGLACTGIPVDEGGMSVQALAASGADLCYVTPSHQFPTGAAMPVTRRAALLHWAAAAPGRYILEDDYDSEFRFDLKPLPCLQGMAGADGPVVYLSTVSKSLAPSIRIAYLVLPRALCAPWRARYGAYANTVSRFEQQTFCRFLQEGYFTRHLARMRNACKARRNALVAALQAAFGREGVQLRGLHTGLHLLLTLPGGPGEAAMTARARAAGVRLTGLSAYYHDDPAACPPNTVVLGYGTLPADQAAPLARTLYGAWRE